jgi:hypothetical protein
MGYLAFKYAVTAGVIVAASEIAKRSDRLGALILSFPLMTLITLVWLHIEKQPETKIANHAWYTFWYVLPSLPMFLAFPWALRQFGFGWAMGIFCVGTFVCFGVFGLTLRRFGIFLW